MLLKTPDDAPLTMQKLKRFAERLLRKDLLDAPTNTEAARRFGVSYRTVIRWREYLGLPQKR